MTTLSLETAEALKVAHWPCTATAYKSVVCTDGKGGAVWIDPNEFLPDPTFDELFERCSKHFPGDFMITNECDDGWEVHAKNKIGGVMLGEGEAEYIGRGPNPKEALANFWLALPEELRAK